MYCPHSGVAAGFKIQYGKKYHVMDVYIAQSHTVFASQVMEGAPGGTAAAPKPAGRRS